MILADNTKHWSTLTNIILNLYFSNLTTICVLQHKDYDLNWSNAVNFNVYLRINPLNLNESFARDVYNYTQQDEHFVTLEMQYDDWIKKLTASVQKTFCEGFVVFQDDISKFALAFREASVYSEWRSIHNQFLFIYSRDDQHENYFEDLFFKNNANILVVEADFKNSSTFSVKTTKFVGSFFEQPHELIELTTFDALTDKFEPPFDFFPAEKLQDLQGREIIVGAFDYRPFVAVDFQRLPQYYDYAEDNPTHLAHIDGTDVHILHTFCALYNCTVQVDTCKLKDKQGLLGKFKGFLFHFTKKAEKAEWGTVFPNYTGTGMLGMILDGKTHMGMCGMFSWDTTYRLIEQTMFLGRSGVTCFVPAPTSITSWTLPLRPFQFNLWLGVFACLCLEAVALLIARQFEQRLVEQTVHSSWWSSIQFGYITTLKLFVSQSSDYVVNSHTVKTVLCSCYMIDIIITSIYGGGLAAILTIPTLEEVADSVERLYKHNLTWTGSSTGWIFSITPRDGDEIDPIFERLLSNYRVYSKGEAREMAKTENMGFVLERLSFGHFGNCDFITPEALDRLKLMVDDIYYQFTVAIVPRLWPHLAKYNELILHWHSSGFDKFWEWKIAADYMNANEQDQMEASKYTNYDMGPVKLDTKNIAGLWMLWMIGICFSIFAFVGEWMIYWLGNKINGEPKAELQMEYEI